MRRALQIGIATLMLLLAGGALAQRVEGSRAGASGPYEAEVPVRSQTAEERKAGFARALAQVLGNLSGDRGASGRPGVGQEMRRAADYVRSYDYRQDEGVSGTTGAPSFQTMLVVRFDQGKVDAIASALGLPIWPTPRPRPVLWLAIDDGSGPRLVGLQQNAAARPVLDRAVQRGYRLGLPAGSAAEQAAAAAIWRGDTAAIARLSTRYRPNMQLLGKLYRHGSGWKSDWIFVDGGRVLSRWSHSNANARVAMANGADGAADALVRRYARKPAGGGTAGQYRVVFTGVVDAQAYARLVNELGRVSVVRGFIPLRASGERLELELDLSAGMPAFRRLVDDGVLVAEDAGEDVHAFRVR
ncbi:MAG: DUF2066 domain-containing protein [Pseudoxanthomonas suwonensis]|nr:DUF2066 domain-containing protein [Pseudoxanthomonas suwonensis]